MEVRAITTVAVGITSIDDEVQNVVRRHGDYMVKVSAESIGPSRRNQLTIVVNVTPRAIASSIRVLKVASQTNCTLNV